MKHTITGADVALVKLPFQSVHLFIHCESFMLAVLNDGEK